MKDRYMRVRAAIFAGIMILGLCGGCGQEALRMQEESAPQEQQGSLPPGQEESAQQESLPPGQEESAPQEQQDSLSQRREKSLFQRQEPAGALDDAEESDGAEATDQAQAGHAEAQIMAIPENGRRLTAEELTEYTEWVQDISNYGFLLSDWENPAQINLYEVFYNGAGVARQGTEEEKKAFLERHDQPEIYTDFLAMDKDDVNALLLEKVGFTYDELAETGNGGMGEDYFAETDSFCTEHGDTNYCSFLCVDGTVNADGTVVTLYCNGDDWVRTCVVKVDIASENRKFLGNHIAEGMVCDMEGFTETHEGELGSE